MQGGDQGKGDKLSSAWKVGELCCPPRESRCCDLEDVCQQDFTMTLHLIHLYFCHLWWKVKGEKFQLGFRIAFLMTERDQGKPMGYVEVTHPSHDLPRNLGSVYCTNILKITLKASLENPTSFHHLPFINPKDSAFDAGKSEILYICS